MDSLAQAVVYYKATIKFAPEFFRGYLNLATVYFTLEEYGECIATLYDAKRIEDDYNSNPTAKLLLASAYERAGGIAAAATEFERAVEENPNEYNAFLALGELYREIGDWETAIKWLSKYPQHKERYEYVLLVLADIHKKQNKTDEALYFMLKALDMNQSNKWLAFQIAELYNNSGKPFVALEFIEKSLTKFPEFKELSLLGGKTAFELGEYQRAEKHYLMAKSLGSANAVIGLDNIRLIKKTKQ
jgi:tetratricopeptide (TPR) repeat protein